MLAAILGTVVPAWAARLQAAIRPNPYAPTLPDQSAVAVTQATRGAIRPGTSGLTGSEQEYFIDAQGSSSRGFLRIVQDITSARRPASATRAGDPGADDQPLLNRQFRTGPVRRLSNAEGANTRTVNTDAQHLVNGTLLRPGTVTPTPRAVATARMAGSPQGEHDALDDYWDGR